MGILFIERYIKSIKTLFHNFITMYTEKRYSSRFSFVVFLMVLNVLRILFYIFMHSFAESETNYILRILIALFIEFLLFVDAFYLKKKKEDNKMSKKEVEMLNNLAIEKGLDMTTFKKYDKEEKQETEEKSEKEAEEEKPASQKSSIEDLPSFTDDFLSDDKTDSQ